MRLTARGHRIVKGWHYQRRQAHSGELAAALPLMQNVRWRLARRLGFQLMAENILFRELCRPDTLRVGWHLAQVDSRDDFVIDPVSYEDFAANLSERLAYIIREIQHERYRPRHLVHVDIPKSGLAVRPGNVLPIDEAALLHAITYVLAPRLDGRLAESVYSYRLAKDWRKRVAKGRSLFREADDEMPFLRGITVRRIDPLEPWYAAWPEFDRQRIAAVRERGYTHLTRTDIAAYFENIDLSLLERLIRSIVPHEPALIALLLRILESWTRQTSGGIPIGRGIPQGNTVCSFLGNIYLLPLDRALERHCRTHKAEWLRYVDDVEVYSRSEPDARAVVSVINDALRRLYLNLQGSKTEIVAGRRLEKELARADFEALDEAWKKLEKLNPRKPEDAKGITRILGNLRIVVRPFRKGLPHSVFALAARESRLLRRSMTLWGYARRPYLKDVALSCLSEPPEYRLLQKSLRYLSQLPYSYHDEIVDRLFELLASPIPMIPFHVAAIFGAIRHLHPGPARLNLAKRVTEVAFQKRADWPVRQQALQLLAILPARQSTALARSTKSLLHHHPFVRRAAMTMLTRAGVQEVRERVSALLQDPDPSVSRLAAQWHHCLTNADYALGELARLSKSKQSDARFVYAIPKLWLLRSNPDATVVRRMREYVAKYSTSASARVRYHVDVLLQQSLWCLD
jgi:hypothetical protein